VRTSAGCSTTSPPTISTGPDTPAPEQPADVTASTVAVYDAIAASYAARRAEMPPRLVQLAQRALAIVRRSGADPIAIADLGCGAGRDLAFFEREQPSAVTVGIDASAAMLEAARPHVQGHLVEGDLGLLPLGTGSQHLAWACASLLHLPKRQLPTALAEARRVLAPGGVLAVTMKSGSSEGFEPNKSETWAEPRFFARYESDELAKALKEAGFSRVTVSPPATDERGETWLHALANAAHEPAAAR
jgi:ubiquinone/menaquinone biosynthesis C-methylase UbiE